METIWFILWGVLWAVYFMLDGFDLGLGSLMPFVAKSDHERRVVYNAMGPFWDGNEVWLLTAGGVTFAAFPTAYAAMFSTLYTPLMLLLFALILRGISFELRSKEDAAWWRKSFDAFMTVGSFLPALLLGVAFANLFRGLPTVMAPSPMGPAPVLQGNLFSLLNPYGLAGGVLFVLLFLEHGALWLGARTHDPLGAKGTRIARLLWPVLAVWIVIFLAYSAYETPLFNNFKAHPLLFVIPLVAVAGLVSTRVFLAKDAPWKAWLSSCVTILGVVGFGVAGMYPNLVPSRLDPAATFTAHNAASSPLTLKIMLGVALSVIPIVIAYQTWVYVTFHHKVDEAELEY